MSHEPRCSMQKPTDSRPCWTLWPRGALLCITLCVYVYVCVSVCVCSRVCVVVCVWSCGRVCVCFAFGTIHEIASLHEPPQLHAQAWGGPEPAIQRHGWSWLLPVFVLGTALLYQPRFARLAPHFDFSCSAHRQHGTGDGVVVFVPAFDIYFHQISLAGGVIQRCPLRVVEERGVKRALWWQ